MIWSQHWRLVRTVTAARTARVWLRAGDIGRALDSLALGNRCLGGYSCDSAAAYRSYDRAKAAIDRVQADIEREIWPMR